MLLLKLLLVPALVAVVTLAVRRWGPAVGGWLSALPVVAGPVLVFYALEQGNAFAARAAEATVAGLVGTAVFAVAYGRCAIRLRWYGCVVIGWSAFMGAIAILYVLDLPVVPGFGCLIAAAMLERGRVVRCGAVRSCQPACPSWVDALAAIISARETPSCRLHRDFGSDPPDARRGAG
jgi:hypothetical protein